MKFIAVFLFYFLVVGCVGTVPNVIKNGKVVSEWDIVNNKQFQTYNNNHSNVYNQVEQFRLDHFNTFKLLWGHKRK